MSQLLQSPLFGDDFRPCYDQVVATVEHPSEMSSGLVSLTPTAAVELINRMQQVGAALAQAGVLKTNPTPTNTGVPTTTN